MKSKNVIIILAIVNIILVGMFCTSITTNLNIKKGKKIIKEMIETEQVTNLQKQLDELNDTQTEYANYIQNCKTQLAIALTNEGVVTSNDATLETMAINIGNVLQARTSNATATAENIEEGKTAYVNGNLIIGTANYSNNITSCDYIGAISSGTVGTTTRDYKLITVICDSTSLDATTLNGEYENFISNISSRFTMKLFFNVKSGAIITCTAGTRCYGFY